MNLRYLINSEGSILKNTILNKPTFFLKTDLMNNLLWKSAKKSFTPNKNKKLETFKTRFFKN
jgi:hypothetical protein